MSQLALFRNTDPGTSQAAAELQDPTRCERDLLEVLEKRRVATLTDLTGFELWNRYSRWREPGTVVTALSRLHRRGFIEVTGKRVPAGKRAAAQTYAITEIGRAALHG